jgi:hypothetical protein
LEDLEVSHDKAESAAHTAATGDKECTGDIPSSIREGVEHTVTRDFAEAMQVVVIGDRLTGTRPG